MSSSPVPPPNRESMSNEPAGGLDAGPEADELVALRGALGTLHGCDGQTKWSGSGPATDEAGQVVCK